MARVLVPLAVTKGETISPGLIDLLKPTDVTLLGYHVVPDQTTTEQAREARGERVETLLEDLATRSEAVDATVDRRIVFTHNRKQTIQRIATETDADAIVTTGASGPIDRLLVSLTGNVDVDRIVGFVAALVGERSIEVTLFAATRSDDAALTQRLEDAASQLEEEGIDAVTRTGRGRPFPTLVDAAEDYDAVIIGEGAPTLRSLVFGEDEERIAAASIRPVLVVRTGRDPEK